MKDPLSRLPTEERRKARAGRAPTAKPMLATLTKNYFSDPRWLFEAKLDGERCLAYRDKDNLRLVSRNDKLLNSAYPELTEAFASQHTDRFLADGEIVAFDKGSGLTSFSRLQRRLQVRNPDAALRSEVPVYIYLFDLLWLDGYDTTSLSLRARKDLLEHALSFGGPISYSSHRDEHGEAFYKEACAQKWEGLIAKRADSRYVFGRSRDWLKFKCSNEQELVIGGYTDPQGARKGFGALLVGFFKDGELVYAGKVGTGFDEQTLNELSGKFERLARDDSPFAPASLLPARGVHWVDPELVAEVAFTEWTTDGRLRHPRYLGLRDDKSASEVVKEQGG